MTTQATLPTDPAGETPATQPDASPPRAVLPRPKLPPEIGGPAGPEPTRYGDWEVKGRCSDF